MNRINYKVGQEFPVNGINYRVQSFGRDSLILHLADKRFIHAFTFDEANDNQGSETKGD